MTVEDAIRMTRLANLDYHRGGPAAGHVAQFSPDGKRFAVVLESGNLRRNTVDYSLYVFETAQVFSSPEPQPIVVMASFSNREAIKDLKWLADNQTMVFLGETPDGVSQVYCYSLATRKLQRLSDHKTAIVAYDVSADLKRLIFLAEPLPKSAWNTTDVDRTGAVITTQFLEEILAGDNYSFVWTVKDGDELFLQELGESEKRISTEDSLSDILPVALAPSGPYAIVGVFLREVPQQWEKYQDHLLHDLVTAKRKAGTASNLTRYMLLDTRNGDLSPLFDAPSLSHSEGFAWAPDGNSVVLSGRFLPLDDVDSSELKKRLNTRYVVEVTVPGRQLTKITDKDLKVTLWNPRTNTITLEPHRPSSDSSPKLAFYRKGTSGWEMVPAETRETSASDEIDVELVEDMNTPPKIFISEVKSSRNRILLDPNPQFAELSFGRVEAVSWKATDGHEVLGGLYLPQDYNPRKKYPLVIQTHGFDPSRFSIDGPFTSAFAAQPLLARGFLVLQVGGPRDLVGEDKYVDTPEEAPREMAAYEGAIDYLIGRAMIDPDKVGIIGFSRSVFTVEYTLTHSKKRFRAATVADGIDAGYISYMQFPNKEYELINGGLPFGKTLSLWIKNSPSFNLDKVQTPVRIEAYSPYTVTGAWEWFAGLTRLGKPVDFIYLPHGTHLLVKPWDRLISQQGNVDWFRFWLKGEEDADPAKADQYIRWRELRKLQENNHDNARR